MQFVVPESGASVGLSGHMLQVKDTKVNQEALSKTLHNFFKLSPHTRAELAG